MFNLKTKDFGMNLWGVFTKVFFQLFIMNKNIKILHNKFIFYYGGFFMYQDKGNDVEKSNGSNISEKRSQLIEDYGQITLANNKYRQKIHLLNIIGEIEGHENLGINTKTSKYEHILPQLAAVEDNENIDGLMVLLNTVGGDVEAGLAIAEMIASLSKPKVCLVLGGGHSIGVPLAVSGDVTYIVPTATMVVHPIRFNDTVLGVKQNFEYIERM